MMRTRSCEVAIVGAGPAGAWAAYQLARRGARVTVFDPSHPREKPCGGGVTGRALALVAPALAGRSVPSCTIRRARFVDSTSRGTGGEGTEIALRSAPLPSPHSPSPDLIVASRAEFDGALLAAARDAGAEIVKCRVVDVIASSGRLRIETSSGGCDADVVIGADGANSLVRRRLLRPFLRDELSVATGWFAHGVSSDEIIVEFVADPPGYIWSFPRPTHLAIGICAQIDAAVHVGALRARVLEWIRRRTIAPDARLEPYAWPIPSLPSRSFDALTVAGPLWYLVGDAAGLVDPITREGIYFALLSGEWAADAVSRDRAAGWRRYQARVRDEIGSELARAARIKATFFSARFTKLLIEAVGHSARIRAIAADLIAGRQPYATLKWRLATTFEIRLALQLARLTLGARSPF